MKTSYYKVTKQNIPGAICISRSKPRYTKYPMYKALAPGPWFRTATIEEYVPLYQQILRQLNPRKVWDELHQLAQKQAVELAGLAEAEAARVEPILLCYELPGEFCHRRLAAEWLEAELGVAIPEGTFQANASTKQLSLLSAD